MKGTLGKDTEQRSMLPIFFPCLYFPTALHTKTLILTIGLDTTQLYMRRIHYSVIVCDKFTFLLCIYYIYSFFINSFNVLPKMAFYKCRITCLKKEIHPEKEGISADMLMFIGCIMLTMFTIFSV